MLRIHPKMLTIWVWLLVSTSVCAQKNAGRDQFFWLGQINKASAVINVDEGLLDRDKVPKIAAGIVKVMNDGDKNILRWLSAEYHTHAVTGAAFDNRSLIS